MPSGQEVGAEWTNSAGLVLCGGDPASQTNVTVWWRICACTTLHWLHRRGQLSQGISGNRPFRHRRTFSGSFSWLWKTCLTTITSQEEGEPVATRAKYQPNEKRGHSKKGKPIGRRAKQTHNIHSSAPGMCFQSPGAWKRALGGKTTERWTC